MDFFHHHIIFSGTGQMFRSLKSRNYRLFFFGQSISLIGSWIQVVALPWLVYSMTNDVFLLGLVSFVGQIPTFFIAPFAGVLLDRWNKHKALVIAHILSLVQAAALALVFYSGFIQIWHVILLSVFLGIINAFEMPARQALVNDMVKRPEDLGNAIALNSSMVNVARLIGPSLAGILISVSGEGICFIINAVSFVFVIISLLMMRMGKAVHKLHESNMIKGLKDGFRYTFGQLPLRFLILLIAWVSLVGMPFSVLLPVFAKTILGGGAHTYGFLMGASGVGSLLGALYMSYRKNLKGLLKLIPLSIAVFSLGLLTFAFSGNLFLSLALLLISGIGMMIQMTACNTLVQTIADPAMRGRVMSFYTMAFIGMTPLGSLLAGFLASRIGAVNTMLSAGIACFMAVVILIVFYARLKTELNKSLDAV